MQTIITSLREAVEKLTESGETPIVLTSPLVRKKFRRIVEQTIPDLPVLSYNEIEQDVEIHAGGVVRV